MGSRGREEEALKERTLMASGLAWRTSRAPLVALPPQCLGSTGRGDGRSLQIKWGTKGATEREGPQIQVGVMSQTWGSTALPILPQLSGPPWTRGGSGGSDSSPKTVWILKVGREEDSLCPLLVVCPWVSHLTTMSLSFPTSK